MAWFDNGPVQRMADEVIRCSRRLGFAGCEVLQARMDAFRATIEVSGAGAIDPPHTSFEGGFTGVQWGRVRVVWRTPVQGDHECSKGVV